MHLYREDPAGFLDRLDGMFALAILDRRARRLVLARDGSGMKPLYYARTPKGLLFASEIKALFASGCLSAAPDWSAIGTYLAAGYVPAPATCFAGVRKLPAGDRLIVDERGVRRERWHRFEFQPERQEGEDGDELEALLDAAVGSHLAADVEVGALLSGGWDSSLIATLAARRLRRLRTFTIRFPESPALDEGDYAREVAQAIGSEHAEIDFHGSEIPELLPKVVAGLDVPCLASPALLEHKLSGLAAASVKTVLGGEGSDELFAGYPWLGPDPAYWLRKALPATLARRWSERTSQTQWARLWRMAGAPDLEAAILEGYRLLGVAEKQELLDAPLQADADLDPLRLDPATAASCRTLDDRRLAVELTRRLPDGLLMVNDRMAMAHSLEVRMPFLDRSIVAFAARLPASRRRRGRQGKLPLAPIAQRLLPARVAARRKFGMQAAMNRYLSGPLRPWLREVLLDGGGPLRRDLLEPRLERWLADADRDRFLRRPQALLFFQTWWNEHF